MLTGDGNEKCKKNQQGLRAKKKFARAAHFFVHFFVIVLHDFNVRETSQLHVFWRKKSYMFLRSMFVSLPLILTLLAANICHFLITALNFFMFFSSAMNFVSFLFFLFVLFCQFRSSFFSVIGVSVMVVGGKSRTQDHVITKFSRILQVTHFFFRTRESFANTHSLLRKVVNY